MRVNYFSIGVKSYLLLIVVVISASAQIGQIEGNIKEKGTSRPVARALVGIVRTDIRGSYYVKTDEKGYFSHKGLPLNGTYTLLVSADGFAPSYVANIRPSGEPIDIELAPGDGSKLTINDIEKLNQMDGKMERNGAEQVTVATLPTQTVEGLEITILTVEKLKEWVPQDPVLYVPGVVNKSFAADKVFAVVRVRVKTLQRAKKLNVSFLELRDAQDNKYSCMLRQTEIGGTDQDQFREFPFFIPEIARLKTFHIENLSFDLEKLKGNDSSTRPRVVKEAPEATINNSEVIDENKRDSDLIAAVKKGDTAVVKELLEKGAHVNAKDEDGTAALILAANHNHLAIVQALLDKGADVNMEYKDGWTALMFAAGKGFPSIVQLLLKRGADVNAKTMDGETALMQAARWSAPLPIVRDLLESGADVTAKDKDGTTPLMQAAFSGSTVPALLMIARYSGDFFKGRDPDYNMIAQTSAMSLLYAVLGDNHNLVRSLLDRKERITTLESAFGRNHLSWVFGLPDKIADVNAVYHPSGKTVLMAAADQGRLAMVQLLLEKGADVQAKDKNGVTSLDYAAAKGHAEIVQLLKMESSPSLRILSAAKHGNTDLVHALLARGANVNARDIEGLTPLMLAVGQGHFFTVKALLSQDADVNAKSNSGMTALMFAAMNGDTSTVQALLAKKADVNVKNNNGETPLLYAGGNAYIIKLLKDAGAKE